MGSFISEIVDWFYDFAGTDAGDPLRGIAIYAMGSVSLFQQGHKRTLAKVLGTIDQWNNETMDQ